MSAWPGSEHHRPCPCGAELADECARCNRINPLGSMRIEPAIGTARHRDQECRMNQDRCFVTGCEGGSGCPRSRSRGLDAGALVEMLNATLSMERQDHAHELAALREDASRAEAQVARAVALAEEWERLADTFADASSNRARLTALSAQELRAALKGEGAS